MIIFVGFAFAPGIPFMIVLSWVALITRYVYFKYIFIRFCRIPKSYNHSMNQTILAIFPISLAFHLIFALWMYGVSSIFAMNNTVIEQFVIIFLIQLQTTQFEFLSFLATIWQKISATWYVFLFFSLLLIIYLLKKIIVDLFFKAIFTSDIKNKGKDKNNESEEKGKDEISFESDIRDQIVEEEISNIAKTHQSLTKSYKLEKNPDYIEILAIMRPAEI